MAKLKWKAISKSFQHISIETQILIILNFARREFGDYYTKAIDETWYKSAVLQHKVDEHSFVYSVPHDDKDDVKEEGDIKVMASHAIFIADGVKEAPVGVVGFQFDQKSMYNQFKQITSGVRIIEKKKNNNNNYIAHWCH